MCRLPPALEIWYFSSPRHFLNAVRRGVIPLLAAFLCQTVAQAQTAWDGSSNTSWGVADNWTSGVPTGAAAITLGNATADTAQTIDLGADRTITTGGSLLISGTGNRAYTIQGGKLILDRNGSNITFINNSGGTTAFTIESDIDLKNTSGTANPVFTISGTANRTINLNGDITALGTSERMTLNAANARLYLRGINSMSQFTLTAGEVVAHSTNATGGGQLAGGGASAILSLASDLNLGGASTSTFLSGNLQIRIREETSSSTDRVINFNTRVATSNTSGSITIVDNINSTGRVILNLANNSGANVQHVPINLGSTGLLRFSQSGSTIYGNSTASGIISGAGDVEITGGGTTIFTAANTYTGTTTIALGTLSINSSMTIGAIAGSGNLVLTSGNTLTTSSASNTTFSGVISGAGALAKAGTGTLTLNGSNTHNGTVTITGGTLQLGSASTTGSLNATSTITNNATLAFNRSNTTTQGTDFSSAAISGTGALVQNGSGTLVLNAANTYTGGTTLNAGTIQLAAANALGTSGNITFGGGTLQYGAGISTDLSPRLKNSASAIRIDTAGQSVAYASAIDSTNSGGLVKSGAGTLTLNGTNAYTGATTINAGTLAVNGSIATSSLTTIASGGTLVGAGTVGALTIASGGTINPGNGIGTLALGDATWNGGGNYNWQIFDATSTAGTGWDFLSSSGTLTVGATSGDKFQINLWSLSSLSPVTDGAPVNFNASSNYSWNIASFSAISGFSADKFQINTLATNGAGGFSGATGAFSISSNGTVLTLHYTAPSATGIWTAGTGNWSTGGNWQSGSTPSNNSPIEFVGAGGTSTNNSALTSVNGLTFTSNATGSYTVNGSALQIAAGGITNTSAHAQTVALDLTLTAAQSFSATGANLTISGAVDNNSNPLLAVGNQTLSIQGSISGSGSLTREENGRLILSAANTYSGATTITAGTLQIGNGGTTGSLNATSTITNNGTLVFNRSNTTTQGTDFSSTAISGTGALVQNGTGTLILTAANTYSGATTITAGTLQIGNGGTTGSLNATSTITNNGTLAFNRSNTITQGTDFSSAAISGTGSIIQNGSGTLTLNAANTFTGGVTLQAGTLSLGNNAALGNGTFTITGGTIDVTAARTTTNNNVQNWNGDFTFAGSNTLNLGTGNITINATRQVTVTASTLTVGAIGDGGNGYGLIKAGAGTLVLTGTHTYTGTTTINGGTLTIGNINSLSSTGTALTVNASGTLSNNTNISSSIGSLAILGGAMNQNGGTITSQGASILTDNGSYVSVGTGSILRFNNTALTLGNFSFSYNNASNAVVDRGLVVSAGITVQNDASVNFTNNSTGIGGIALNGNQTITVGEGSTMNVGWSVNPFGGSPSLTKTGNGTLVLSGSNTYSGATTINSGTLQAANANALGTNANVTVTGGSLLVSADGALSGKNITLNSTATAGLAFSGNYNGSIGKLTLETDSIIDLGTGNSVVARFAELEFLNDSILKIYHWSGTTLWEGGDGDNTDQIYFASGASGNLDRISFYSDFGNSFLGNGYQILGGEFTNQIIPVPEPETWATAVLLLLSGLWFWKKQRKEKHPSDA